MTVVAAATPLRRPKSRSKIRPANSAWLVLVALVLGLVLGAGAVSLTWFMSRHASNTGQITTDAALDATTACADLDRVPSAVTVLVVQETPGALARLSGAVTLAQAAAAEDTHYQRLADVLDNADRLVVAWPDATNGNDADAALTAARVACGHP
jgi:hypothetical protein